MREERRLEEEIAAIRAGRRTVAPEADPWVDRCEVLLDRLAAAARERQRWEDQANGQLDRAQRAERELREIKDSASHVAREEYDRADTAESALAEVREAVEEYLSYPTLAGRRQRLDDVLAARPGEQPPRITATEPADGSTASGVKSQYGGGEQK